MNIDPKTLDYLHEQIRDPAGKGVLKAALQEEYRRGYKDCMTVDAIVTFVAVLVIWAVQQW